MFGYLVNAHFPHSEETFDMENKYLQLEQNKFPYFSKITFQNLVKF